MRRTFWLLLLLAGCAGPDADPVDVAERFHDARLAGDDGEIHALLTDADRRAVPLGSFPAQLPSDVMLELLGWRDAEADSAALVGTLGDTATVVLYVEGGQRDTLRLVATHEADKLLFMDRDRVTWRVSMRLAERTMLDSLAAGVRARAGATDSVALAAAETYLRAAETYPALSSAADVDAAQALLRTAEVARALEVELHMARSIQGVPFVEGRIANPSGTRINTLRLVVRDADGREDPLELWDIAPGGSAPVWRLTQLRRGPLTYRVDRIQVF